MLQDFNFPVGRDNLTYHEYLNDQRKWVAQHHRPPRPLAVHPEVRAARPSREFYRGGSSRGGFSRGGSTRMPHFRGVSGHSSRP